MPQPDPLTIKLPGQVELPVSFGRLFVHPFHVRWIKDIFRESRCRVRIDSKTFEVETTAEHVALLLGCDNWDTPPTDEALDRLHGLLQ